MFRFFILCLSIALSACAVTYKSAGEGVSGYRDLALDNNQWYVEYTESNTVSWDTLHEFVIKRSAELAVANGFTEFVVLSKDEQNVSLESSVAELQASGQVSAGAAPTSVKVAGKRLTYKIQLEK